MHIQYILDAKQKREDANILVEAQMNKCSRVLDEVIDSISQKKHMRKVHKKYNLHEG